MTMTSAFQKLTNRYAMDTRSNSTLQDMVLLEKSTERDLIAVDALMWLRRCSALWSISLINVYEMYIGSFFQCSMCISGLCI